MRVHSSKLGHGYYVQEQKRVFGLPDVWHLYRRQNRFAVDYPVVALARAGGLPGLA
jgi:hypothetical protein